MIHSSPYCFRCSSVSDTYYSISDVCVFFRGELTFDAEEALAFLAKYCKWAVVTLASKGCIAKHGKQVRSRLL